jgi:hypothetical protein
MATTTPNFGWSVPTSSDLVKNGATAIETLGDSIDASLVDLKGGTTGQVLAKATNTDMDFTWTTSSAGMTNPMTTTGDTIYSSSGSTPARLGIGTTGQVLTVSGGLPTWATAGGGGGMTSIASGTLSGASLDLTSISSSYNNLQLVLRGFYFNNAANCRITINNTNGIYTLSDLGSASNSAMSSSDIQITSGAVWEDAANKNAAVLDFFDYKSTTSYKVITSKVISQNNASSGANNNLYNVNIWAKDANAISRITLYPSFGNFSGGTYILYGVK